MKNTINIYPGIDFPANTNPQLIELCEILKQLDLVIQSNSVGSNWYEANTKLSYLVTYCFEELNTLQSILWGINSEENVPEYALWMIERIRNNMITAITSMFSFEPVEDTDTKKLLQLFQQFTLITSTIVLEGNDELRRKLNSKGFDDSESFYNEVILAKKQKQETV